MNAYNHRPTLTADLIVPGVLFKWQAFTIVYYIIYSTMAFKSRLPRSVLGPGVDVGLTEFGGAGCSTGVSAYR